MDHFPRNRFGSRRIAIIGVVALIFSACGQGTPQSDSSTTQTTAAEQTEQPVDTTADAGESPDEFKEIVIALGGEPPMLDAHLTTAFNARVPLNNVLEPLVTRNPDGTIAPRLATELPESIDDTTWRVRLREGVSFQNGEPFNADTVIWNIERIVDPVLASTLVGRIATIVGAEKVDDYTVDILTSTRDALLPKRLTFVLMMPPAHVDAGGLDETVFGTGPYQLTEWVRGQYLVLDKSPTYWGEEPEIDRVTIRFIEEPGTRLSALLAGELDLIVGLDPGEMDRVPRSAVAEASEQPVHAIFDTQNGPTADLRVRQAMAMAVDRQEIADTIYSGLARPESGQIASPGWFGYNPDLEGWDYDPEEARRLIQEAGAEGAHIRVVGSVGRWPKMEETVQALAGYWQEIGLDVEVDLMEHGAYVDVLLGATTPTPAVIINQAGNEVFDVAFLTTSWYHSDSNRSNHSDAELDALVDSAHGELDPEKRAAMYYRMAEIMFDLAVMPPFVLVPADFYGMSDRLQWEPRADSELIMSEMSING